MEITEQSISSNQKFNVNQRINRIWEQKNYIRFFYKKKIGNPG